MFKPEYSKSCPGCRQRVWARVKAYADGLREAYYNQKILDEIDEQNRLNSMF